MKQLSDAQAEWVANQEWGGRQFNPCSGDLDQPVKEAFVIVRSGL
jgi:hypothetical protein